MTIRVLQGDCTEMLPTLAAESFHACVTDPPYHLTTGKKGGTGAASLNLDSPAGRSRIGTGFMGQRWDGGDIAQSVEMWREVWRVLKPGAHLVAFGGVCPTTPDGAPWQGWGTALKPAWEPIILARKPLIGTVTENVLAHGTGALNIDACMVPASPGDEPMQCDNPRGGIWATDPDAKGRLVQNAAGRWPANVVHDGSAEVEAAFAEFGERPGQLTKASVNQNSPRTRSTYGRLDRSDAPMSPRGDSGTASRFFYSAKADSNDRAGSWHPTIKPTDLMRWLVQLVCPPGGRILDPFAGSGSTGLAADQVRMDAVLIEQSAEYCEDIRRKITADAGLFAEVV